MREKLLRGYGLVTAKQWAVIGHLTILPMSPVSSKLCLWPFNLCALAASLSGGSPQPASDRAWTELLQSLDKRAVTRPHTPASFLNRATSAEPTVTLPVLYECAPAPASLPPATIRLFLAKVSDQGRVCPSQRHRGVPAERIARDARARWTLALNEGRHLRHGQVD